MHFLCADEPGACARAVVSLLREPARRRQLGVAGRRLVEERYSWAQVAAEFEAKCKAAVDANDTALGLVRSELA